MATIALFRAGKAAAKALGDDKPYTSVSVWIERLCSESYSKDDLDGIPDLVDSIQIQATGPAEATRAIRKKLKYGNVHRQIRALVILKLLVENCGDRFQQEFYNERLVERIKIMAADPVTDASVKKTLMAVLASWHNQFKSDPGMRSVANLYSEVKGGSTDQAYAREQARLRKQEEERQALRKAEAEQRARERQAQAESLRRQELEARERKSREKVDKPRKKATVAPTVAAAKRAPFNLEREKSNIMLTVATATQACNGLVNALQHVNREAESVTTNLAVQEALIKVKDVRKKVVRYIQLVEHDETGEYIGTLLSSNEQILAALALYDRWSKPVEHDSEDEELHSAQLALQAKGKAPEQAQAPDNPDVSHLAAKTQRMSLVRQNTELDRLQDRQSREIERLKKARAQQQEPHPDLADLMWNESSNDLQDPLEPKHVADTDSASLDLGDGLSDYSDYSSSDEDEDVHYAAPAASTSTNPNRAYTKYLDTEEQQQVGQESLLDDPFADPEDVVTPGLEDRRMEWRSVSIYT